jgi:hypothetical protein
VTALAVFNTSDFVSDADSAGLFAQACPAPSPDASATPAPNSPPPPSPSPPPSAKPKTIAPGRAYSAVRVAAALSGTVKEWESPARRSAFETACEKAFAGSLCFLAGAKAGSVVLDFTVVQYVEAAKDAHILHIADQFFNVEIMATFRAAVLAATGSTFESELKVVSVTTVGKDGKVDFSSTVTAGAVAGIVLLCLVIAAAVLVVCVCAYRKRRATPSDPVKTSGV